VPQRLSAAVVGVPQRLSAAVVGVPQRLSAAVVGVTTIRSYFFHMARYDSLAMA